MSMLIVLVDGRMMTVETDPGEDFGIPMCSIHISQLVAGFDQGTTLPAEIQNMFAAVVAAHNHKNLTASYTLPGLKRADLRTLQEADPTRVF